MMVFEYLHYFLNNILRTDIQEKDREILTLHLWNFTLPMYLKTLLNI